MQNTATYIGVFSRRERTAKGMVAKKMYFVWEAEKAYLVQELDRAYQPTGSPSTILKNEFTRTFVQEKQIHAQPVEETPAEKQAKQAAQAEQEPKKAAQQKSSTLAGIGKLEGLGEFGELPDSADTADTKKDAAQKQPEQPDQKSALRELELRESFGKAILRLKRPRFREAALQTLQNLSDVEEGIEKSHKHMFADFGVSLRQNTLLELALHCCQRVLELAPDDDHAHFNAARILFEMKNYTESKKHLMRAIEMNPEEPIYERMLRHVEKTQLVVTPTKNAGAKVGVTAAPTRKAVSVK